MKKKGGFLKLAGVGGEVIAHQVILLVEALLADSMRNRRHGLGSANRASTNSITY